MAANEENTRPNLPDIPDRMVNICDYGAKPGGKTKNTEAFREAITDCAQRGGGRVVVPRGLWLTGPITLRSHIDLHLKRGALIVFSPDFEDYNLVRKDYEGQQSVRCESPINCFEEENLAITGHGVMDGSGQAWRPVKRFKMTDRQWKELLDSGGAVDEEGKIWWPSRQALHGRELVEKLKKREKQGQEVSLSEYAGAREYLRPVMVGLVRCRRVLLDGPTFQNSPAWNIHPLLCEEVTIRDLNVRNPWYAQNGDGLDLESCRRVVVENCRFDVGDDGICLKSGKNEAGRRRGRPCEDIEIADCTVYHGHGGFVIGSEMSGGVRSIDVRDCTFMGTDIGLRFKSTRGRGGTVEKIRIRNINMLNIKNEAIRFNMFYTSNDPGNTAREEVPVTEETPVFREISVEDVSCRNAERAVSMRGLPEMPIREITLKNVNITAKKGLRMCDAEGIELDEVNLKVEAGPVMELDNAREIVVKNIEASDPAATYMRIEGQKSDSIHLEDSGLFENQVEVASEIDGGVFTVR